MPKQKESKMFTRSIYKQGRMILKDEESEEIEVVRFEDDAATCTVSVDKAITKNLGNYNSLKISGFISVPCYLNDEEIDRAFEYAAKKLDDRVGEIYREEMEGMNNE